MLQFFKYQGTGNDFVIIDNRDNHFDKNDHVLIEKLCDRRFGVGGDGLMLLQNHNDYDFEMLYFNADGKEGTMCGNGGRCLVQFAFDVGVIGDFTKFIAVDGEHEASLKDGLVRLKMTDVDNVESNDEFSFMDTGSPHYVAFVKGLKDFPVFKQGKEIRNNSRFKTEGTNVNFVEELAESNLFVRTYERGVEDETWACGTGVTASVLAYSLKKGVQGKVDVKVLGGDLAVEFEQVENGFTSIYLTGPARKVFEGKLDTVNLM